MTLNRRIPSLLLAVLCLCPAASAQRERSAGHPKSVGASFSIFGSGPAYQHWASENTFHEVSVQVDYISNILDRERSAGVTASYLYAFDIVSGSLPSGDVAFHLAPGVTAGYVQDYQRFHGLMGGLVMDAGFEFRSRRGVTVSAGVTPTLAAHISRENPQDEYPQMKLWKYGLMRSLLPHVGVALSLPASRADDVSGEAYPVIERKRRLLSCSLEWSGAFNSLYHFHHNYVNQEGSRYDLRDYGLKVNFAGEVLVSLGFNVTDNLNLSLYSGYMGLPDQHRVVPLSIRGTWYFGKEPAENRWFAYADAGVGFRASEYLRNLVSPVAKAGFGYRIPLGAYANLDFFAGFQFCHFHPDILYPDGSTVPPANIRRNNENVAGVRLGAALAF